MNTWWSRWKNRVSGDPVTVVYAVDDRFGLPLTVSARSLVDTYDFSRPLNIFVLDGGLRPETKRNFLESLPKRKDLQIRFLQPDLTRVKSLFTHLHFSSAIYLRLLIPDLLGSSIGYALYLDADTVVLQNVAELFSEPRDGFPLWAAQDYLINFGNPIARLDKHLAAAGIDGSEKFFNSGVLLFHLEQWRKERIADRILRFCEQNQEALFLPDQNALNICLHRRIGELDFGWNYQFEHKKIRNGEWKIPTVSRQHIQPRIYHFTSEEKPWLHGCEIPEREEFVRVWRKTSWPSGMTNS